MHARHLRSTRLSRCHLITVAAIAGLGFLALRTPAAPPPLSAAQEGASQEGGLIEVCHCPPGNPDNCQTIVINPAALPAHLAHGDTLGPCSDLVVPLSPEDIALIRQLVNEILVRVSEIDIIISTNGGTPPIGLVRKFTFSTDGYDTQGNPTTVDIEMDPITVIGDITLGCAKDPPGISCECPCPDC